MDTSFFYSHSILFSVTIMRLLNEWTVHLMIVKNVPGKYLSMVIVLIMTVSKLYLQIDLFGTSSNAVSGVVTQGSPNDDEWVTKYSIKLGEEECSLRYIRGIDDNPLVSCHYMNCM